MALPSWLRPLSFCFVNTLVALYSPVLDCDETYNYWEPLHFLAYGTGLQTWEYAPAYALRSYAYLAPFLPVVHLVKLIACDALGLGKPAVFFAVRCVFGLGAAGIETWLCKVTERRFGDAMGKDLWLLLLAAPGVSQAAIALLPSSTCMLLVMIVLGLWIEDRLGLAVAFSVAAVILPCWPFVALAFVPFALHALYKAYRQARASGVLGLLLIGAVSGIVILGCVLLVDLFMYNKVVLAAWNIVKYNALGESTGDNLYGVEPASYYVKNLILNLNIGAALCIFFLPMSLWLFYILPMMGPKIEFPENVKPAVASFDLFAFCSGGFLWLAVMMSRPHKEERFLYVAYPFLLLAAAAAMTCIRTMIWNVADKWISSKGKRHGILATAFAAILLFSGLCLGLLRGTKTDRDKTACDAFDIMAVVLGTSVGAAYGGVLQFWSDVYTTTTRATRIEGGPGDRQHRSLRWAGILEWFRFPGSFFIPGRSRGMLEYASEQTVGNTSLAFVRSTFRGQLPQYYGPFPDGAAIEPAEPFNDRNEEEVARYRGLFDSAKKAIGARNCDFYVEFVHERMDKTYMQTVENNKWRTVVSVPFLDGIKSGTMARSYFAAVPWCLRCMGMHMLHDLAVLRSLREGLQWGEYKLFAAPDMKLGEAVPGAKDRVVREEQSHEL